MKNSPPILKFRPDSVKVINQKFTHGHCEGAKTDLATRRDALLERRSSPEKISGKGRMGKTAMWSPALTSTHLTDTSRSPSFLIPPALFSLPSPPVTPVLSFPFSDKWSGEEHDQAHFFLIILINQNIIITRKTKEKREKKKTLDWGVRPCRSAK